MRPVHRGDAHSAFPLARVAARPCPSMTDDRPSDRPSRWPSLPPSRPARVADVQLRGRAGPLRARAFWPAPASTLTPTGRPPLLVLFPRSTGTGGGVDDGTDGTDGLGRGLCARAGLVVLAVRYRPPSPGSVGAALEDATTATQWAADHAAELGADPRRLLVAGEGAGADLAATVARQARDEGWPRILRQVLVRPRLSSETLAATPLAGLAPATVLTDPADAAGTDDGARYTSLLRRSGVPVDELPAPAQDADAVLSAVASSLLRALDAPAAAAEPDPDGAA
jgi:acetyl esterase/lipase